MKEEINNKKICNEDLRMLSQWAYGFNNRNEIDPDIEYIQKYIDKYGKIGGIQI